MPTFGPRQRLTHARQFQAVYAERLRKSAGPLTLHARPNGLAFARLGLAVGRPVGTAAARNRVKRLLREAFRLSRHEVAPAEGHEDRASAGSYDLVVGVRAHKLLTLNEYGRLLRDLEREVDREHRRRVARRAVP